MRLATPLVLSLALLASSAGLAQETTLVPAYPNLSFTRPVDIQNAGDGSNRLFVVEQAGIIRVFSDDSLTASATTFLDIRNKVDDSRNEEGLLGLAFHPDFSGNGYFFVNYTATNPDRTVIARYSVSAGNPDQADPASEVVILEVDKPEWNHNAGQLAFGPADGYLYLTTGDGGGGGDPFDNGQDRTTLLGNILRIDVDNPDSGRNYGIPADNPYAGNSDGFREEIWAYGFRNPWRFSFDPATGRLWLADVGQNRYEEINIVEPGRNYGWSIMEGESCYDPNPCDTTGLTLPIWTYSHSVGVSITGGYVYRGSSAPELNDAYIYADYGSGRVWRLTYDGNAPPVNSLVVDASFNISTFGVREDGELLLAQIDLSGGPSTIYQFRSSAQSVGDRPAALPEDAMLLPAYPNPFNPSTTIPVQLSRSGTVSVTVFDARGAQVRGLLNAARPAGLHELVWDGRDDRGIAVGSGTYLAVLKNEGRLAGVRRITLVR